MSRGCGSQAVLSASNQPNTLLGTPAGRAGSNQQRVTVTSGGNVSGLFGRLLGSRTFKTSFVWLISTFPDLFSFRRQHRIVDSEYRDIVAVSHQSIFHNGIAAAGRQRFASRSRFLLPGECLGPSGASLCRHAPEAVTAHCHANCSFWCEGVHIIPRIHLVSVLPLPLSEPSCESFSFNGVFHGNA